MSSPKEQALTDDQKLRTGVPSVEKKIWQMRQKDQPWNRRKARRLWWAGSQWRPYGEGGKDRRVEGELRWPSVWSRWAPGWLQREQPHGLPPGPIGVDLRESVGREALETANVENFKFLCRNRKRTEEEEQFMWSKLRQERAFLRREK